MPGLLPRLLPLALAAALAAGCGARSELSTGANRSSTTGGQGGGGGGGGADACQGGGGPTVLAGRIRDFHDTHPDFEEGVINLDPGIVEPSLGSDGKPVYAGADGNPTTSGQANFDTWYRDVEGVNLGMDLTLPLEDAGNGLAFASDAFFPIDGQLFGDEGRPHNYHFTLEAHATFRYRGGEVFAFEGDDDLWAFIDRRLALDLGGVHGTESGAVSLDELGLTPGEVYPLDVFFAERQTSGSTFHVWLVGFDLCP
jgi:fibro-slime domain-containing protein